MGRIVPNRMLLLAALLAAPAQAKDGFDLSGSFRLRAEAIDGQTRAGYNASDALLNMRTTVKAQYDRGALQLVAELWDSRVYGGNDGSPVSTNEVNALELVQAHAAASIPLGDKRLVSLQAGRFTLNLGSRRLVAADDYRNTTNGYTGLKADFVDGKGTSARLIYVLPQQRRPDNLDSLLANEVRPDHAGFDLVLWGGLAAREKLIGLLAVEAMFMRLTEHDHGDRQTRDRRLNNLSLRLLKKPRTGEMDLDVEAISQSGKIAASTAPAAPTLDVQAWFLHGSLGYSFPGPGKVRVSAEYDQASGDGPGGGYGRFDTLFGMRRGELGPAGLYNAFGRANVISPGLRVEAEPFARTEGFLTLRPLWLDSPTDSFSTTGVRDARGQSGRYAGTQFDMRVRQRVGKALQLELNVVLLGKGRFLLEAPSAPQSGSLTRYLSLSASSSF